MTERSGLVADPAAGGDSGHRAARFGLGQDRFVLSSALVAAALLDDEAQIHAAPTEDVLDGIAGPGPGVRDAFAVHELGDIGQRALGKFLPDAAYDRGLLGHDGELAGVDEAARGVTEAPIAERVVAPVPAVLEEPPLNARHPLGVKIALELGRQTQLAVEVAPGRAVEARTRQVRHEQRHLAPLEFMKQVEHEASVAGEAREVVDGDRRHLARSTAPRRAW